MYISHVFLDLDGVVRLYDNSRLFQLEEKYELEKYTFFSYCFKREILEQAVTGNITDEVWKQSVIESFQTDYPDLPVQLFIDALWNSEYRINYELLDILKKKFSSSHFYLATNATTRLKNDLSKTDIMKYVDGIINSSDIGLKKPNGAFFEYLKDTVNGTFRTMLFIDDSEKNVKMAKELGIRSFLYTGDNIALKHWINTL